MIISYSNHIVENYKNKTVAFDKLPNLLKTANLHWLNHQLKNGDSNQGYRNEENCLIGFNLLVLDVDGGINLSTAQLLLKKYKAIFQTTKRHSDEEHRFRVILPMNYTLKLDAKDYKEFYANIVNSLPFEVDTQTGQRSRKWETNGNAIIIEQDGELFDVLPYIPKTTKNEERQVHLKDQEHLDNLERWVINNTGDGNRNNMLLRYTLILLDAGFSFDTIKDKTIALNNKLADKLDELELANTVFHTLAKRMAENKSN